MISWYSKAAIPVDKRHFSQNAIFPSSKMAIIINENNCCGAHWERNAPNEH